MLDAAVRNRGQKAVAPGGGARGMVAAFSLSPSNRTACATVEELQWSSMLSGVHNGGDGSKNYRVIQPSLSASPLSGERSWARQGKTGALAARRAAGTVPRRRQVAGAHQLCRTRLHDRAGEPTRVAFYHNLWRYLGAFVLAVPILVFYRYTGDRLSLAWRQWMTEHLIQRYFSNRVYYRLRSSEMIDNPDQRITEDVKLFTTDVLGYLLVVVNSVVTLAGFVGVLWGISGQLMVALLVYTGVGTLISVVIGRRLVGLYFQRYQKADFRYGLIRVRDHAESIAFFRGERREHQDLLRRFGAVARNMLETIGWSRNLQSLHPQLQLRCPGRAGVGGGADVHARRGGVRCGDAGGDALCASARSGVVIVSYFENLSASAASVQRISDLCDAFDAAEAEEVQMAEAAQIAVSKSRKRLKTKDLPSRPPIAVGHSHAISHSISSQRNAYSSWARAAPGEAPHCAPLPACGRLVAESSCVRPSAA